MVVYADLVLGINLIINVLLLYLTGWVCGVKPRWPRLVAAAGFGALYALSAAAPAFAWLYSPAVKAIVSWLMIILSFGARPWRRSIFMLAVFYLESFLLGGAVLGWSYFWSDDAAILWHPNAGTTYDWRQLAGGVAATGICTVLVARRLLMRAKAGRCLYSLSIEMAGRRVEVQVALDTGNALYTPIGRRPVIPVQENALRTLFSDGVVKLLAQTPPDEWLDHLEDTRDSEWLSRLEIIPCRCLTGSGLMLAFRPDLVELRGRDNSIRRVQAVIGIIGGSFIGYGAAAGLLHPALLGGTDYC